MNEEIKEILFLLYNDKLTENGKRKLEDYITNLQEENESLRTRIKTIKRLRKKQTQKKNKYKSIIFDEEKKLKDYKEENEKLKKANKILEDNWLAYMKINQEAIEYIKNNWYELNTLDIEHCVNLGKDIRIDLLNILQGSEDNG